MNITKKTSTVHTSYYANRPIEYLVIHYTAGTSSKGGTAASVANMFGNPNNRAASADFIVDDNFIVQFNGDIKNRYTYAVGGNKYLNTKGAKFYGKCKNYNSISIEICSSNSAKKVTNPNDKYWYFTDAVINNAIELARYLMDTYKIAPDHLIRHWDVNGKPCPGIIGWNGDCGNEDSWISFKNKVLNTNTQKWTIKAKEDDLDMTKEQFLNSLTSKEAYNLVEKAMGYAGTLPESNWSINEGHWRKATQNGVVDGQRPHSFITREEITAVLGRILGEIKRK